MACPTAGDPEPANLPQPAHLTGVRRRDLVVVLVGRARDGSGHEQPVLDLKLLQPLKQGRHEGASCLWGRPGGHGRRHVSPERRPAGGRGGALGQTGPGGDAKRFWEADVNPRELELVTRGRGPGGEPADYGGPGGGLDLCNQLGQVGRVAAVP